MCKQMPGRAVRLPPVPGGRVTATASACLPNRSSPWISAELWWLATAAGPTAASAAAARSACSPAVPRAATAAGSAAA
jgi:hypothetical protein